MQYKPYDYQKFAEDFIVDHKAAGLLLDMGMGKTVITLTAVQKLLDLLEVRKVLIIAPLRPAKETWPAEIGKWDHLQRLTWSLVLGSAVERKRALEKEADIYIINRENVVWLTELYKKSWPFDMVVIDELSSFKSSSSERFRAMKRVRKYIDRVVGLTGTPAPNGLLDLWPEMYLLDEGKALGKTITGYRQEYFVPSMINGHMIYLGKTRKGAAEEIYRRIEPLCISMKSEDYLKLPDTMYIRREGSLTKEAKDLYDQLERDMLLPLKDGDIDAPSAAVLLGKLMQMTGGAVYDENGEARDFHSCKMDILEDLIEEANGQPVLIYYAYKHERDRIMKRFKARDIKEEGTIAAWNRGEVPIMLAHPASAGHGLNLQSGGHIIIWYDLPLSLELYQQANKRLPRPGQKHMVLIHHILMKDTVDSHILDEILSGKAVRQNALIEAVKARVREL